MLFQAVWNPILGVLENFVKSMINPLSGEAPLWVVGCFQVMMGVMWLTHDMIYAPLFGRGDGLTSKMPQESDSQQLLYKEGFA